MRAAEGYQDDYRNYKAELFSIVTVVRSYGHQKKNPTKAFLIEGMQHWNRLPSELGESIDGGFQDSARQDTVT